MRTPTLSCCLLSTQALADPAVLTMAQDRYEAGSTVLFDGAPVTDLFLAGNRVTVAAPVAGSAHLAGRRVTVASPVAGDLFALGYSVEVPAAVGGDATVSGYELTLGPVAGNLRAAGSEVTVGSVGGYALVTGEDITLSGPITGDMVILAGDIIFGPAAKVTGNLTIYAEDPSGIEVPETVAPKARVTIKAVER